MPFVMHVSFRTLRYPRSEFGTIRMVREETINGKKIHVCDCGLGYDDNLIAYACEEYFRVNGVNSEEITKLAIYNEKMLSRVQKKPIRQ